MRIACFVVLVAAACNPPPPRPPPPPAMPPAPPPAAPQVNAPAPMPAEPSPIDESQQAKGHLSASTIQRVVRANMNKMSACYQAALAKNQNAPGGKVRVRLVIGRDGRVASAANQLTKSDSRTTLAAGVEGNEPMLADHTVVGCVVDEFRKLQFPAPNPSGIVVATYPLIFSAH